MENNENKTVCSHCDGANELINQFQDELFHFIKNYQHVLCCEEIVYQLIQRATILALHYAPNEMNAVSHILESMDSAIKNYSKTLHKEEANSEE